MHQSPSKHRVAQNITMQFTDRLWVCEVALKYGACTRKYFTCVWYRTFVLFRTHLIIVNEGWEVVDVYRLR